MKSLDKYRGCLVGGAAGDALGYAVEFLGEEAIFQRYSFSGITEHELAGGVAQVSDDTQMTLFTANALLLGTTRGMTRGIMGPYAGYASDCHRDWLRTQEEAWPLDADGPYTCTWLVDVPELFAVRAPGNTCLSAVRAGARGTIEEPVNDSEGCGGVMRVAPVGLYFEPGSRPDEELDRIGAEVAAVTHGHELGYIPAAALTHIVRRLAHEGVGIGEAVRSATDATARLFPSTREIGYFTSLMDKAIALAADPSVADDLDAIHELGQGWVAEETLAIAVYCALRHPGDFEGAVVEAVNHGGDSDSTGAVAGNIVGAHVGLSSIPHKFTEKLELRDVIVELADDLFKDCPVDEFGEFDELADPTWASKYICGTRLQILGP